jgi:hypothetical protein
MNFRNRLFIALALGCALCATGQDGFTFDPQFADNMVLQRSTNTMISGHGPPGKTAWITFKGKTLAKTIKTDPATGRWRASLNLSRLDSSGDIEVSWRKGFLSSASKKLSNILIGDVWLVAGWEGQGVDGRWSDDIDDTATKSGQVRFWNLNRLGDPWPDWENWPLGTNVERFPDIVLRAAFLAMDKENQCIGIVIMPGSMLEKDIADPTRVMVGCVLNNPVWLTKGVVKAQAWRRQTLIDSKHAGIVTNIPPITNYDAPVFLSYGAFSPNEFPAQSFAFKGVLLPAHAVTFRPQGAPTPH